MRGRQIRENRTYTHFLLFILPFELYKLNAFGWVFLFIYVRVPSETVIPTTQEAFFFMFKRDGLSCFCRKRIRKRPRKCRKASFFQEKE